MEFLKKVEDIKIYKAINHEKNILYLTENSSLNVLLESFIKEANKIDRLIYKSEKCMDELSKDMINILIQEIKIKTFQKTLTPEFFKVFVAKDLIKPMTKMLRNIEIYH